MSLSSSHEDSQSNTYGTHTPIISPQYNNAFNAYAQSLGFDPTQWMPSTAANASSSDGAGTATAGAATASDYKGPAVQSGALLGANALQKSALGWQQNNLANNPVDSIVGPAPQVGIGMNQIFSELGKRFDVQNYGTLLPIENQAAPQLTGTPQATASTSADAPAVNAATGASMAAPYAALYGSAVTDPSLAAYDYGTDRAFSALDARTAGAGAFGNTRSGLGYSDLGQQTALGRGQLASGLLNTGLTNAFNFGQTDASRKLAADTTTAGNILNNNQFNAGLLTNNSQFNTGLLQDTAKTNLSAQQTNTNQKLQAAQQVAQNLQAQGGLTQQIINNVVTANGVDTAAANQLYAEGTITQAQLASILSQAAAYNGSSYTENKTGSVDRVSGGISLPLPGLSK